MMATADEISTRCEWRPIDTAPKDGTAVLVFCPMTGWSWGQTICVAAWDEELTTSWSDYETEGAWRTQFGNWTLYTSEDPLVDSLEKQPTHWMTLPEPPK